MEILSKQLCIQSERHANVKSQMKDITNLEIKISEKEADISDNANSDNAINLENKISEKGEDNSDKLTQITVASKKRKRTRSQRENHQLQNLTKSTNLYE